MSTIFIKSVKKGGKKRMLILYPEKRYTGIATLVIGKEEVIAICSIKGILFLIIELIIDDNPSIGISSHFSNARILFF